MSSLILNSVVRGELLYGRSAVHSALKAKKRSKHFNLFMSETHNHSTACSTSQKIVEMAEDLNIPIHFHSRSELNDLVGHNTHNNFILDTSPLSMKWLTHIDQLKPHESPLWVCMAGTEDPRNLGAILRSALFFGATGVLVPKSGGCGLTPTVARAAAGALDFVDIRSVKNIPRTLRQMKKTNKWNLVALDDKGRDSFESSCGRGATLLLIGNEGFGTKVDVLDLCDSVVSIKGGTEDVALEAGVDCLNASIATAIALYELTKS